MVAELLDGQPDLREFARLLRHDSFPDGTDPEERVVFCGISWERYLALDQALGDDRPGPRIYYLEGELEIRKREKGSGRAYVQNPCREPASSPKSAITPER